MKTFRYMGNKKDELEKIWLKPKKERDKYPKVVGVIPDLHLPYEQDYALDFIVDTFMRYGVSDIVFIGDMVDFHTVSNHGYDPDGYGPMYEYELTNQKLQKWFKEFPEAKYIMGNHDNRIKRIANTNGIPGAFVKSFRELFNIPDTWEIDDEFIIDNVNYSHGLKQGGIYSAANTAKLNMMSSVIGHYHAQGGVYYINNGAETIFGMSVGALVNDEALAFQYGKFNKYKSLMGCGVVINDKEAYFIPYKKE